MLSCGMASIGGFNGSPDFVYEFTMLCAAAAILSPLRSLRYCQNITPAYQPNYAYAFAVHAPKSVKLTSPVLATSNCAAGLPTTILFNGTPLDAICFTAVLLKNPVDAMNN